MKSKVKGNKLPVGQKEKLGKLTGNRDLEERGDQERFRGKVQDKVGKIRRKVGEAVEDLARESPANGDAGDSFFLLPE